MNASFQKITAVIILAFSITLFSCEHDKTIAPDLSTERSSESMRENLTPTLPKKYQLTKYGDVTLSYLADGKLQKVTRGPIVRGSFSDYTTYTYKLNSISATSYKNNKRVQQITYLLDAKGNCYESKHVDYVQVYPNPEQAIKSGFVYIYNSKGKLMLRKNSALPNEKTDFSYDTADNLVKITNYAYAPGAPNSTIQSESTLGYIPLGGDPLQLNLYPINVEAANLPDPYLQIFGKAGKFLVKLVTEKGSLGGTYFKHTLNADGYPTKRETYTINGATLTETKDYDYLVTNIGFNL